MPTEESQIDVTRPLEGIRVNVEVLQDGNWLPSVTEERIGYGFAELSQSALITDVDDSTQAEAGYAIQVTYGYKQPQLITPEREVELQEAGFLANQTCGCGLNTEEEQGETPPNNNPAERYTTIEADFGAYERRIAEQSAAGEAQLPPVDPRTVLASDNLIRTLNGVAEGGAEFVSLVGTDPTAERVLSTIRSTVDKLYKLRATPGPVENVWQTFWDQSLATEERRLLQALTYILKLRAF